MGFYDCKERLGALSQVEVVAREEAKAEFRKWGLMEETSWNKKSREVWLKG